MKLIFKKKGKEKYIKYSDNVRETICELIEETKSKENTKTETYVLHLVYLGLYSFKESDKNLCMPSMEMVANKISTTKSTVSRSLKVLEEYGIIFVKPMKIPYSCRVINNYFFPLEYNLKSEKGRNDFLRDCNGYEDDKVKEYFSKFVDVE